MLVDDGMFGFGSVFITVIFVIVIGSIVFSMVRGVTTWNRNNNSPILEVQSKVVTKRTSIRGGAGDSSAHTSYFVTFEVTSGDRIELQVNGQQYGLLVEGDSGTLKFQRTRYLSFTRSVV
ncbi:MAG: DUF2500 domain-containing protein [Bacillus sp. (in: firmicutes)]